MSCIDVNEAADLTSPATLAHLRACDRCLSAAAERDPDLWFRALGGEELTPPGGVEAFVGDVMTELRFRERRNRVESPAAPQRRWRWSAAAAAIVAVALSFGLRRADAPATSTSMSPVAVRAAFQPQASRPVVESYDAAGATIVEVDPQVVMVFDESLPADL